MRPATAWELASDLSANVWSESAQKRFVIKAPWNEAAAIFKRESPGTRLGEVTLPYAVDRPRTRRCRRACRIHRCEASHQAKPEFSFNCHDWLRMRNKPFAFVSPITSAAHSDLPAVWATCDLDLARSPSFGRDPYDLFATMADRNRLWHNVGCPSVSRGRIAVSVIEARVVVGPVRPPPQAAEGEISAKAEISTKRADEDSMNRKPMTRKAAADCKPVRREAATDKMRAARHAPSESRMGGRICCAEYQDRGDHGAFPRHGTHSTCAPRNLRTKKQVPARAMLRRQSRTCRPRTRPCIAGSIVEALLE